MPPRNEKKKEKNIIWGRGRLLWIWLGTKQEVMSYCFVWFDWFSLFLFFSCLKQRPQPKRKQRKKDPKRDQKTIPYHRFHHHQQKQNFFQYCTPCILSVPSLFSLRFNQSKYLSQLTSLSLTSHFPFRSVFRFCFVFKAKYLVFLNPLPSFSFFFSTWAQIIFDLAF